MTKTTNLIKKPSGFIFSAILVTLVFSSITFAQDFKTENPQEVHFSANVLSASVNFDSESMFISYNGMAGSNKDVNASKPVNLMSAENFNPDVSFDFNRKFKQISDTLFRFFNVDELSSDDEPDARYQLKSKVNTKKRRLNHMDFDLSLLFGSDDDSVVKMDGIKLGTSWNDTHINAIYHYEKDEIELGLSTDIINDHLMEGMTLEFQANPNAESGAVVLIMNF